MARKNRVEKTRRQRKQQSNPYMKEGQEFLHGMGQMTMAAGSAMIGVGMLGAIQTAMLPPKSGS